MISWIVHPRDFKDIESRAPLLKVFPHWIAYYILMFAKPFKASDFSENGIVKGDVIAISLLPIHFQRHPLLALKRVRQALALSKALGVKRVSVGGMITGVIGRNKLAEEFDIEVYDGTDLLAVLAGEKVREIMEKSDNKLLRIGIIGATTKSGSKISRLIAGMLPSELHLFAKTEKNVNALAEECKKISSVTVSPHIDLKDISQCDITILTAFISEEDGKNLVDDMKKGSYFISAIEPVSPFVFELEKNRMDMYITRGITISAPGMSYGKIDGVVASGQAFVCLTEALVVPEGNSAVVSREKYLYFMTKNNFKAL